MNPKRFLLKLWAKYQLKSFRKKFQNPVRAYEKTWKYLKSNSKNEALKNLSSFDDLRQLPLTDYSDYKDDFKASLKTKINPHNGESIDFWATSTGSTGEAKLYPISKSVDWSYKEGSKFRVASLISAFNIYSSPPEMIFVMPGEKEDFALENGIGQIGYYHYQHTMPKWLETNFTFSKKLYFNKEQFNQWHVLAAVLSDCSGITTSIPARITHFLNEINRQREEIIQTIKSESWPKELVHKPSKKRLDFVLKVLANEVKNPKDLWPSLQFMCIWKAGKTCQIQLRELERNYDFSEFQVIDQMFNATEGLFNFPLINTVGGPVNIFGILLEFYHRETDQLFWPWELKENEHYELIVTNTMGLTRYKMSDTVVCTGHFEEVAVIEFHSRSYPEINLGWGHISEEQLVQVLDKLEFEKRSEIYFQINKEGNGITLVSHINAHQSLLHQMEKVLIILNKNYDKQLKLGNFSPMSFLLLTEKEFADIMHENANNKRLLHTERKR